MNTIENSAELQVLMYPIVSHHHRYLRSIFLSRTPSISWTWSQDLTVRRMVISHLKAFRVPWLGWSTWNYVFIRDEHCHGGTLRPYGTYTIERNVRTWTENMPGDMLTMRSIQTSTEQRSCSAYRGKTALGQYTVPFVLDRPKQLLRCFCLFVRII